MTSKYVVLAVLCVSLSGCGAALQKAALPADATAAYSLQNTSTAGARGHQRGGQGRGAGMGAGLGMLGGKLAADLNLTDAQKASIKAISAKYHPAKAAGATKDPAARKAAGAADRAALDAILKSNPFDAAGAKALLDKRAASAAARSAKLVDGLAEVRDVLTADQREKLATGLEAQAAKAGQPRAPRPANAAGAPRAAGGHGNWNKGGADNEAKGAPEAGTKPARPQLTADQKTAVQAALKSWQALRASGHQAGDRLHAQAAFWRTGDKAALSAALAPSASSEADAITFLGSLDASTRALVGRMVLGGGQGRGRRGGRGRGGRGGGHKPGTDAAAPTSV